MSDAAARLAELREVIATQEARIADLEAELLQLRHRVVGLEHRCNDRQEQHNTCADADEQLIAAIEAITDRLTSAELLLHALELRTHQEAPE